MTWNESKARAGEILRGLRAEMPDRDVRLILRALTREFQIAKSAATKTNPPRET